MDLNGYYSDSISDNGEAVTPLPMGFAMALAMNERAMSAYAGMTESEKEQIILKCKDAKSKEEMHKIVDSLVPDGNVNSLFEGPSIG